MEKIYDLVILGAGPAGLSAGIYGGRSRLSTLIIEQGKDGGQIAITSSIENYPGQMLTGETGATLIARMTEQARLFGGMQIYLPKGNELTRALRDREIYRQAGRIDIAILARQHNLSMKQIWEIQRTQRELHIQRIQPTLF